MGFHSSNNEINLENTSKNPFQAQKDQNHLAKDDNWHEFHKSEAISMTLNHHPNGCDSLF